VTVHVVGVTDMAAFLRTRLERPCAGCNKCGCEGCEVMTALAVLDDLEEAAKNCEAVA